MSKESSYRKQKRRIKELERHIKLMVLYPDTDEAIEVYMMYQQELRKNEQKH